MITMIGTEERLEDFLFDLILLDYDAAAAYGAAIDRLENASSRARLVEFRSDHLRHARQLAEVLDSMGRSPPHPRNIRRALVQGKVTISRLVGGDGAILQAMQASEDDTNTAYGRATLFPAAQAATRRILESAQKDERRHWDWILSAMKAL